MPSEVVFGRREVRVLYMLVTDLEVNNRKENSLFDCQRGFVDAARRIRYSEGSGTPAAINPRVKISLDKIYQIDVN